MIQYFYFYFFELTMSWWKCGLNFLTMFLYDYVIMIYRSVTQYNLIACRQMFTIYLKVY
jgi:hypothetical protein